MRYSDCYPGCGGEDCPCCEIHIDHLQNYGRDQHYPGPWRPRSLFEEEENQSCYEDDEDELIRAQSKLYEEDAYAYPCDGPDSICPFDAQYSEDCRYYCGLGVDEDEYPDYDIELDYEQ